MERTLLWSAFAIGLLGWICALLLNRSHKTSPSSYEGEGRGGVAFSPSPLLPFPPSAVWAGGGVGRYLFTALAVTALVWLATLPSHPPFAPGHGFGDGFVVGAFGALLATWALLFAAERGEAGRVTEGSATAAATAPLFLGVVAATIPALWMRANLIDALLGVGIGWFVVAFLMTVGLMGQGREGQLIALSQVAGVGFTTTLVLLAALGDYRGTIRFASAPLPISWSAIVLAFSALVPFLILLCGLPASLLAHSAARLPGAGLLIRITRPMLKGEEAEAAAGRGLRLLLGAALLLGGSRLFAARIEKHPPLVMLTLIGLGAALIAWWLTVAPVAEPTDEPDLRPMKRWQHLALAAIALLAGAMAAYQIMAGVGLGVMLLVAWFVGGLAVATTIAEMKQITPSSAVTWSGTHGLERAFQLLALLIFAVILAVYRLFMVRFVDELHGVQLTDHYALFGFLLGALFPALLVGFTLSRPAQAASSSSAPAIGRILVAGLLVLAVPALVLILFGAKCAMALFFGLAFASILTAPPSSTASTADIEPSALRSALMILPALFALAVALALGQWTHHILPLSLYARAEKIRLIGYLVGALVVLILLADYGERLQSWMRARRGETTSAKGASR